MARKLTTRFEMLADMADQSWMDRAPGEEYYKDLAEKYLKVIKDIGNVARLAHEDGDAAGGIESILFGIDQYVSNGTLTFQDPFRDPSF